MHCPYCGKEISENAKVCPYCGKQQHVTTAPEAPAATAPKVELVKQAKLQKKKEKVKPRAEAAAAPTAPKIVKSKRQIPKWIWALVGVLVVAFIVVTAFPFGKGSQTGSSQAQQPANPIPTNNSQEITSAQGASVVRIDGKWIGEIKGGDGDFSALLELNIEADCFPGEICGTYSIVGASCHGNLELVAIDEKWVFEFIEHETTGGEGCISGGHQFLRASGSNRLSYGFILDPSATGSYETTGILDRQ